MGSRKSNNRNSEAAEPGSLSSVGFDTVQTAVVVVDSQGRVLRVNPAAKKFLEHGNESSYVGQACHELICGTERPCEDCLLQSSSGASKSHAIRSRSGKELFVREELLRFPDFNVLILFDVTREITALRNLDLTRKELKAKTILLERKRHVAADEKRRIEKMFDQLPDAFVQVDKNYIILYKNNKVSEVFPQESAGTCYALIGNEMPCTECPMERGVSTGGERKVIHRTAGRCFTEHIIQSPGEDAPLLLFSDTTRQIELIEKIRDQQETITRKNDILSNLVSLQTRMQKAIVTRDMINYFLDMLLPLCGAEEAFIIIDDIRPGSVWFVVGRGVDDSQSKPIVRNYLSRDVQQMEVRKVPAAYLPWKKTRQMELIGGNGRKVGMIFYPESDGGAEGELIHLFSEPFGAFIHNRLLLRQLEEKANTDSLTGLYNRRYLEGALAAERKKNDRFGIPYSIIVVDVNRLKEANDIYGHEVGDRLLQSVSERLKLEVRTTDTVGRTGGDEFVLLLADTREEGARNLAKRFSENIFSDVAIDVGGGERFPVTLSLGVAGSDQVNHDDLLRTADKRMYEAKEEYYRAHPRYR